MDSPIETFLDDLADRLTLRPRTLRRVLREVEGHLHESALEFEASGLQWFEAEQLAVDRFGAPDEIATQLNEAHNAFWTLPSLGMSAASLFAFGLIVIGVSGVIIWVLGDSFGYRYIVTPVHEGDYSAARCEAFLSFHPEAADCSTAAMLHHYDEIGDYRVAAGVMGLIGLVGLWLMRRFIGPLQWLPGVSRPVTWAIASAAFAIATVAASRGVLIEGAGSDGAGQLVATAVASALGFSAGVIGYYRSSRKRRLAVTFR